MTDEELTDALLEMEELLANARLMVLAPTLAAALQKILDELEYFDHAWFASSESIKQAKIVLKAVRGEKP